MRICMCKSANKDSFLDKSEKTVLIYVWLYCIPHERGEAEKYYFWYVICWKVFIKFNMVID